MLDRKLMSKKEKIRQHIEDRLSHYHLQKQQLDRLWYTSLLFYRGEQWITYDNTLLQFRRTNQRRVIPRPVTNRYAPTCNTIIAALSRFDPRIMIAPQTDSQEDIKTAQVANRVVKTIENEVHFDRLKAELLPWLVLTGIAYLITGVDMTSGKKQEKISMECPQCGYTDTRDMQEEHGDCPQCWEGEHLSVRLRDVVDEKTGAPKVVEEAVGKLVCEVANPLQMFVDYRITDTQDQQTIIRIQPKAVEWLKAHYPAQSEQIDANKRRELNTRMLSSLSGYFSGSVESAQEETADVVEAWHKPCKEYPNGYYTAYTGEGVFLELREFPFRTKAGECFYPIARFLYDRLPGSYLGRTPAFDLIEKQKTRNRVEAIGEMILMRMSNPVWLTPKPGTNTPITGHVGQQVEYDPHQTNGAKPERVEGAMMPQAIVHWLDRIDRDFDFIPGISEVSRGERPPSGKSGFYLSKLQEISNDRQTGLFTNYSIGVAEWQMQALELFRQIAPNQRYGRILGDNNQWTVSKFQEADLAGGVDIYAEPGAWAPKTHLERLATLETFIQIGLVDVADPLQKLRIHREYGLPGLLPTLTADDDFIAREHDRFKNGKAIQVSPFDNHMMHWERHLDFWKSEMFETFPPEQKDAFLKHLLATQFAIQNGSPPPPGFFDRGEQSQEEAPAM